MRTDSAPDGLCLTAFTAQGPFHVQDHALLQRQAARESNARSYPRRIPLALREASGIYVRDASGHVFIDCLAGAGSLPLGHNHPAAVDALHRTLREGSPLHTLDFASPAKDRFVEALFSVLPPALAHRARIHFCGPTGADAVEAALKLARLATGRGGIWAFDGGYHGCTSGTSAVSGNFRFRTPMAPPPGGVHFLPFPSRTHCPFGLGGDAGVRACASYLEHLLGDPESGVPKPAAVILEVVQGEGGVNVAPAEWLRSVRDVTRRHGVLLVVDEIQTGLARTGALFACEHADIEPDILVLSKAIGGGLPLAVIVYDESLDCWPPGAHIGTFRGNVLAMAAGSATIGIVAHDDLAAHAHRMGERLIGSLREVQAGLSCVADVRGLGLMLGVELKDPHACVADSSYVPAMGALAREVQAQALSHGLIVEVGGRNGSVVRLLPPLIVCAAEVDVIVQRLSLALAGAQKVALSAGLGLS